MEQEGFFKTTAFGGFDKKSVLSYIDTLTEKFHETEEEYKHRLDEFAKAQDSQVAYIKKLEAQLSDTQGKLEAVATQLEDERASAPATRNEVLELQEKNEELKSALNSASCELEIQNERCRQLTFKMESLEFKGKKYDDISTQIGDAVLAAQQNAERAVEEARAKAAGIVAAAKNEAAELLAKAEEQARETSMHAEALERDTIARTDAQAKEAIAQANARANETIAEANAKASETITEANARVHDTLMKAQEQMTHFYGELGSFKSDSARLRKSVEEILFVLNDRVDVMQEVVRQVETRYHSLREDVAIPEYPVPPEAPLFEKTDDEAGLFGGISYEDTDT